MPGTRSWLSSLRFCFAFLKVDERNGDVAPTKNVRELFNGRVRGNARLAKRKDINQNGAALG